MKPYYWVVDSVLIAKFYSYKNAWMVLKSMPDTFYVELSNETTEIKKKNISIIST